MKLFKVAAIALLGIVVVLAIIMTIQLGAKDSSSSATKEIVVVSGMSRAEIAKKLSEEGLIKSQFAFFLYLKMIQAKIIPGTYEVSAAESASMIADNLARAKFKILKITLIEGYRATDIERYLVEEKGLKQLVGFANQAAKFEGYLFPDTYEVKIEVTTEELIALLRENFTDRTKELAVDPDILTLASIVEREAKSDDERSAIAGVYVNRLNLGMNLEADATVQYAKGDWRSVTIDDYRSVESPYNTYLNAGLPPGPISTPGLASIKAAIFPEKHSYLFYFHAQGQTYFSKTYQEHRAKTNLYF